MDLLNTLAGRTATVTRATDKVFGLVQYKIVDWTAHQTTSSRLPPRVLRLVLAYHGDPNSPK